MQQDAQISLNAIRVFASVARHESISHAASKLGVTASAVSHQVKNLEDMLATPLFHRRNNAISLSPAGRRFLTEITPGLNILSQATNTLLRDQNEITIRASITLAVRWLVPALERFKIRQPKARVRLETGLSGSDGQGSPVDIEITYRQIGQGGKGEKILADFSRPVVSPTLLRRSGFKDRRDVFKIPAISCTDDNWDWALWREHFAISKAEMRFGDHYDIDDAALRAATAGFGMVLAPALITKDDITAGSLAILPDFEPVEMGAFYLHQGPRIGGIVREFRNWLLAELAVFQ